jgi:hypothetical protein
VVAGFRALALHGCDSVWPQDVAECDVPFLKLVASMPFVRLARLSYGTERQPSKPTGPVAINLRLAMTVCSFPLVVCRVVALLLTSAFNTYERVAF